MVIVLSVGTTVCPWWASTGDCNTYRPRFGVLCLPGQLLLTAPVFLGRQICLFVRFVVAWRWVCVFRYMYF